MDLHFTTDPEEVPVPREEVRIKDVTLEPFPDGRRLRVLLTLTPFRPMDRPNISIDITDQDDAVISSTTIIETVQNAISLTMHLRPRNDGTQFTVHTQLYYEDDTIQDTATNQIEIIGTAE